MNPSRPKKSETDSKETGDREPVYASLRSAQSMHPLDALRPVSLCISGIMARNSLYFWRKRHIFHCIFGNNAL